MYGWSHKSVRDKQTSSFSSSLLDEIYRSMDAGDDNSGEFDLREDKVSRKQGGGGGRAVEDGEISSLRRAFLVQKWTDIKTNTKNLTIRTRTSSLPESHRIDDGPPFLGSVLSSSDLSSGYVSEPIGFCELKSQKPSYFGPLGSKSGKGDDDVFWKKHQHVESDMNNIVHGPLIKSKARASKIYAKLKKVKQPISPGGRLMTFLNSLLANRHLKKPKVLNEQKIERKSKSTHGSTCSSASSFTKSCLSKNSPRSREKLNNGIRRTVSFYPVSVIIDEDCRPCGEKFIYSEQDFKNVNGAKMMSKNQFNNDDEIEFDDMTSDASSDLFELDHLSTLQECQELSVFETTHFDTKCALANGLIW